MKTGRRLFISSFALALADTKLSFAALQRRTTARVPPMAPPDGSAGDTPPNDIPPGPPPDPTARLKESQKNIRRDADHLLELAKGLKDEADATEQTSVLSLSLVKKAEEVEKLARQIKDLVRAA